MERFDAVVVGCGAMGSSASYNLAKRGIKVLNLERYSPNHSLGSSHGETRIFRLAYFEDTRYVPLLRRALDSWRELQRRSEKELIRLTGGLMVGGPEGELLTGVLRSAKANALPHRVLSSTEATEEFPVFRLGESCSAVHDPNAGVLFSQRCLSAFVELAREEGGEFRFNEPVIGWERKGSEFEVRTSAGTYAAERMVLCPGAWMGGLSGGLVPLEVERQVLFWFDARGKEQFAPSRMPVFIVEEKGPHYYYGIPDVGEGVKVARHHEGAAVDPDSVDRNVHESDALPVEAFVSGHLPLASSKPIASSVCLYSNTPDGNFVVDFHPTDGGLVLVSACSGHGFKFASVMGEVVADLVAEGRTRHDVSFLWLGRFQNRGSPGHAERDP